MNIFVNLYISYRWNLVTNCAVSSDMRFVTRCFTRALAAASRRPTAACGEPLQLHEPMQLQSCVGIFAQITPNSAPLRLHARLTDCAARGGRLSSRFHGWSGYPSIAVLSINSRIDVMG